MLAAAGGETPPKFETPDKSVVDKTNTEHPQAQCRLDTYFQASLCSAAFDYKTIPARDLGAGNNNSPEAEAIAAKYSCFQATGYQLGNRPACWFKQQARF